MKYSFTTGAKEIVTVDRSLLNGKVKVYVNGKEVGPSHRGARGATGTFYPIKSGTLEVRSSMLELVPRVWYNEDWVDLVAPLTTWQFLLVALPFLSATLISFGQILGIVAGALGALLSLLVMRSQRPVSARVMICLLIAILAPVVGVAASIGLNMLAGGAQ